jgi:cobaltochelatase CobS
MRKSTKAANPTLDVYPIKNDSVCLDIVLGTNLFKGKSISVPIYEEESPYMPVFEKGYVFDPNSLIAVVNFLANPLGDALYLFGPSGCGKTSVVSQVASLLGWPMIQTTLNGRFELADLIGHPTICGDQVMYVHGPLARAMKYGYILVLNEIDLADPSELAGLNDVLEGRALVVVQNDGEIIEPHPNFRLVATANTRGGGEAHNYCGTQILNSAFLDRFRFIPCTYMSAETETKVLKKAYPELTKQFCEALVRVASEVRDSNLNCTTKHIYMSVPMSPRALLRWAGLVTKYKNVENPVDLALEHAFTARMSKDESTYVHRLYRDVSGENMVIFE